MLSAWRPYAIVLSVGLAGVLALPSGARAQANTSAAAKVAAPWCHYGETAGLEEGCVVWPSSLSTPATLLIYLHGVIAPGTGAQEQVQGIVARNAQKRGYVAYMPRGKRGLGPTPVKDWWAWPTTAEAHRRYASSMVASWMDRKRELEARLGSPFERTYLAGSSNGAFFAAVLALKGEIEVDGIGAMSGGGAAGRSAASLAKLRHPPFYVGYGRYDDLKPYPIALGQVLAEAKWPSKVSELPTGHGARQEYLDQAFDYWTQGTPP